MANEAVQVEGPYEAHDFTVTDSIAVPQYTLMGGRDPRGAYASSGADDFAGIAATEKVVSNGQTELGLFTTGTFVLTAAAGAVISAGELVSLSGANLIKTATEAEIITGHIVGKSREAIAAGTTGEVKLVVN